MDEALIKVGGTYCVSRMARHSGGEKNHQETRPFFDEVKTTKDISIVETWRGHISLVMARERNDALEVFSTLSAKPYNDRDRVP